VRDGSGIAYNSGGGMMLAEVADGPEFRAGDPRLMFDIKGSDYGTEMDLSIDGSRLLVQSSGEAGEARRIAPHVSVVLNWFEELEARKR